MSNIIQFLPVERLDDLIRATGFDLSHTDYEWKFQWLVERIAMFREHMEAAAIVHDNPEVSQLVAVIQQERKWSDALRQTIAMLESQLINKQRDGKK